MNLDRTLDESRAFLILNGIPTLGPVTLQRLLEHFDHDPVAILQAPARELTAIKGVGAGVANMLVSWPQNFDLEREEGLLLRHGVNFVTRSDSSYPALLLETYDPPIGIYRLGSYAFQNRCVAIVGTRRPTLYGRRIARALSGELVALGFCVVSGMARGIDTEAHQGALDRGGRTVAVMGCGIDIIYPPENLDLYRAIAREGAVVSEFPFGRRADRQTFPMRNRIIAGICDATVVVETDTKGGSMITARFAGEQGRQVFAVPGHIDQPSSRGCHALIRDGATLLTSAEDILADLPYLMQPELSLDAKPAVSTVDPTRLQGLSQEAGQILETLSDGSVWHPDQIAAMTGLAQPTVLSELLLLELRRIVGKRSDGAYEQR